MKKVLSEINYVLKSLDKSTNIKLIGMVIATIGLSILFFIKFENPVVERWKENREIEQSFNERQKEREHQFDLDESDEPKLDEKDEPDESDQDFDESDESESKEPIY